MANCCPMCKKTFQKVTASKTPTKIDKKGRVQKLPKEVKIKNKRQSDHFDVDDFHAGESESEEERYIPRPSRRRAPRRHHEDAYEEDGWLVDDLGEAGRHEGGSWEAWGGEEDWVPPPSPARPRRTRIGRTRAHEEDRGLLTASGALGARHTQVMTTTRRTGPGRHRRNLTRAGAAAAPVVIDLEGITLSPPRRRQRISRTSHRQRQQQQQQPQQLGRASSTRESIVYLSPLTDGTASESNHSRVSRRSSGGKNDQSRRMSPITVDVEVFTLDEVCLPLRRARHQPLVSEWFHRHEGHSNSSSQDHMIHGRVGASGGTGGIVVGSEVAEPSGMCVLDITGDCSNDDRGVQGEEGLEGNCLMMMQSLRERLNMRRALK